MSFEVNDFAAEVIERSRSIPVVVDFWAPWCGPCKMLGPVIEQMAGKAAGRWELVKVNTEEHEQLAREYNISSIPCVKMFRDGIEYAEFMGFLPEDQIEQWLKKLLPSSFEEKIQAARELAEAGNLAEAIEQLKEVLLEEPGNEAVRIDAAEWLLRTNAAEVSELLVPLQPDADHHEQAEALRVIASIVVGQEKLLDSTEGKKREAIVRGLAGLAAGDYSRLLDGWIEAIERQKDIAGGQIAEGCKAVFRFLGPRHPVSEAFYRRFTGTLYS